MKACGAWAAVAVALVACTHSSASVADRYLTIPPDACAATLARNLAATPAIELQLAYYGWPTGRAYWYDWMHVALRASRGLPLPGAGELAVTAIENAAAVSDCSSHAITTIRSLAQSLDAPPWHDRVVRLAAFSPSCDMPGETRDQE